MSSFHFNDSQTPASYPKYIISNSGNRFITTKILLKCFFSVRINKLWSWLLEDSKYTKSVERLKKLKAVSSYKILWFTCKLDKEVIHCQRLKTILVERSLHRFYEQPVLWPLSCPEPVWVFLHIHRHGPELLSTAPRHLGWDIIVELTVPSPEAPGCPGIGISNWEESQLIQR